jgi:hypothetical protein
MKKDAFTILMIVTVFGILRYFISIYFPIMVTNPVRMAGSMLVVLILEAFQSAVFTFAYLSYVGESHEESWEAVNNLSRLDQNQVSSPVERPIPPSSRGERLIPAFGFGFVAAVIAGIIGYIGTAFIGFSILWNCDPHDIAMGWAMTAFVTGCPSGIL